ncbi:uncharacterized protein LOC129875586 [Solanum dulcamara]|uniref:uncharacterized protein LOC129875586 n=1 Tax=Solanum dulcamara TaxID=45834 RepID=UPI002485A581|nr:uncharacterized protein LOC129875586 [Solanum dulcamara]
MLQLYILLASPRQVPSCQMLNHATAVPIYKHEWASTCCCFNVASTCDVVEMLQVYGWLLVQEFQYQLLQFQHKAQSCRIPKQRDTQQKPTVELKIHFLWLLNGVPGNCCCCCCRTFVAGVVGVVVGPHWRSSKVCCCNSTTRLQVVVVLHPRG